jgi:hypothetical protein
MVDFLGRFESLQEDFNKICEQLNISDPTLPYVNASRNEETWRQKYYLIKNNLSFAGKFGKDKVCSKDYHDYYDQQEKEIVGELYQKDIEYFNYQF